MLKGEAKFWRWIFIVGWLLGVGTLAWFAGVDSLSHRSSGYHRHPMYQSRTYFLRYRRPLR
jgi:hypothetical protein